MNSSVDENPEEEFSPPGGEIHTKRQISDSTEIASSSEIKLSLSTKLKTEIKEELFDTSTNEENNEKDSLNHVIEFFKKLNTESQDNLTRYTLENRSKVEQALLCCDSPFRQAIFTFFSRRLVSASVEIPKEPQESWDKEKILLIDWNIGIFDTVARVALETLMGVVKADIICLQEIMDENIFTPLREKYKYECVVLPANYVKHRRGLLFLIKKELMGCVANATGKVCNFCNHSRNPDNGEHCEEGDFEYLTIDIKLKDEIHTIVNFYHASVNNLTWGKRPERDCLRNVCNHLGAIHEKDDERQFLHVVGDLNPGDKWNHVKLLLRGLKKGHTPRRTKAEIRNNASKKYSYKEINRDYKLFSIVPGYWNDNVHWITYTQGEKKTRPDVVLTKGQCSNMSDAGKCWPVVPVLPRCIIVHEPINPIKLYNEVDSMAKDNNYKDDNIIQDIGNFIESKPKKQNREDHSIIPIEIGKDIRSDEVIYAHCCKTTKEDDDDSKYYCDGGNNPQCKFNIFLSVYQNFLDKKEEQMKDEGAKNAFGKFRRNAMNERGEITEIDQIDRIIKVVTHMDAEMFFSTVFSTGFTIKFSDDKTLNLLLNIHRSDVKKRKR